MDDDDLHVATPVLADLEDAVADGAESGGGRQLRHVLIPSELVSVELDLPEGGRQTLQADLINVSSGGCCLVLPRRLPVACGARGVMRRPGEVAGSQESRMFVVRWVQKLGEMVEIGGQYVEAS